jgi:hypothetical protein
MPVKKKSLVKSKKSSAKGKIAASTKKAAQGVKHQSIKVGSHYIGETEKNL